MMTVSLPNFTEAPFIHKRNNLYYLSYAAGWPERIEYATATSITGPWTHRGAIISQTLPSETNHQSIVLYNGIWYFTYHNAALEGGGPYNRSVCMDVLNYNSHGIIQPVTMTSGGVASIGAAPFKTNTNYKIKAEHSGKLLEVANASLDDVANVQQYTDNGNYCQQWSLTEVGNGVFEITNRNSGLVLDADLSNDNVIQYSSWGGDNQKWKLAGTDEGTFFIVNLASCNVLDVLNAETGDGVNVQHWGFNGLTCQQWELIEVDANTGLQGDVNSDGNVDIVDALLTAQFYVGLNPSDFNQSKADTNCDGSVNIVDALLIAQYYIGLISGFCQGE